MRKIHEHIIRIPALISREQLWAGIEHAMRYPELYVEHMVSSQVLEDKTQDGIQCLTREINFGQFRLKDTVALVEGKEAQTSVSVGGNWPASAFLIRIEEPEAGSLFVRFVYEEQSSGENDSPMVMSLRRQAYEAKDRVLIERILKDAQEAVKP